MKSTHSQGSFRCTGCRILQHLKRPEIFEFPFKAPFSQDIQAQMKPLKRRVPKICGTTKTRPWFLGIVQWRAANFDTFPDICGTSTASFVCTPLTKTFFGVGSPKIHFDPFLSNIHQHPISCNIQHPFQNYWEIMNSNFLFLCAFWRSLFCGPGRSGCHFIPRIQRGAKYCTPSLISVGCDLQRRWDKSFGPKVQRIYLWMSLKTLNTCRSQYVKKICQRTLKGFRKPAHQSPLSVEYSVNSPK